MADVCGMYKVTDELSGATIVTTQLGPSRTIKCPVTGALLKVTHNGEGKLLARPLKQNAVRSRSFNLRDPLDINIARCRATNGFNHNTNEKHGSKVLEDLMVTRT